MKFSDKIRLKFFYQMKNEQLEKQLLANAVAKSL
jgi:hypothetical protein